ncbi:hypothetical protein Sjap_020503 [Stephania japonica]|uniref:Uncharacterized protein n=1 Tax=Stephania japonica TaxID=461633 RepID=A0AAP0F1I5_9MAGN
MRDRVTEREMRGRERGRWEAGREEMEERREAAVGVLEEKMNSVGSKLVIFVGNPFIPCILVLTIRERPEEPQKESKEDQPLVLVKPPTLPCLPVKFNKGVVVKKRSQIFYMADTFVSDDHDVIDSYVLEVSDELLNLKEGISVELPKAIDASFVVDISKG